MAVIVQNGGNSLLGSLGAIATLGGAAMGMPWLGAIGTGLNAANAIQNGNYAGAAGALLGSGNNFQGGLNQILSSLSNMFTPKQNNMSDKDLYNLWSNPYQYRSQNQKYGGIL